MFTAPLRSFSLARSACLGTALALSALAGCAGEEPIAETTEQGLVAPVSVTPCGPYPRPQPTIGEIYFFENHLESGPCWKAKIPRSTRGDVPWVGDVRIPNDRITAVYLGPLTFLTVYDNAHFGGRAETVDNYRTSTPNTPMWDDLGSGDGVNTFNDRLSSFKMSAYPEPRPLPKPPIAGNSAAYTRGFEKFNRDWDHTYFCLSPFDGENCRSITGYGVFDSTQNDGTLIPGTIRNKSKNQMCLADIRATNNPAYHCGRMAQLYGMEGVCHQHTSRGQMSPHGEMLPFHLVKGGRESFALWGAYGISYPICAAESQTRCALTR